MISNGSMPASRWGTASVTSIPMPARLAVSLVAHVRPAPQVLDADDEAGVEKGRHASINRFSSTGRQPARSVAWRRRPRPPNPAWHAHAAVPSRPVVEPTARPGCLLGGLPEHQPVGREHARAAFTSGLPR
jgi:hypothetical protein